MVYLGVDGALDDVVEGWLEHLGAAAPLSLRLRMEPVVDGDATAIDEEIAREEARLRLQRLHALPAEQSRAIEMVHDRLLLMIDDKTLLDEEDLLPASIIVFGRGDPATRRVGSRVFLCPGMPTKRVEGMLLLDEGIGTTSGLTVMHCDVDGNVVQREFIEATKSLKLRVQGAV